MPKFNVAKFDIVKQASTKVLESVSDEDKKALLLSELRQIEQDKDFQKIKKMWVNLDDDQKLNTYNKWNIITVYWSSKLCMEWILPSFMWPLSLLFKKNRLRALSPVIRLCVNVWLLDAPKQLNKEDLMKNIQDDADNLSRNLKIFWAVSKVIKHPALQIASKIVSIIIPYADWYKKNWAPLMQDRVEEKIKDQTWENIVKTLSITEENTNMWTDTEKPTDIIAWNAVKEKKAA